MGIWDTYGQVYVFSYIYRQKSWYELMKNVNPGIKRNNN